MAEDGEQWPARSRDEARRDAAQALRRLLNAVEAGELEADSPQAKALLRRLQGAVTALEADEQ